MNRKIFVGAIQWIALCMPVLFLAGCATSNVAPVIPDSPGENESSPVVNQEEQNTFNISGVWDGLMTHELVEGPCPSTPTQQGTVLIEQTASGFDMQFGEGFDCNPVEACDFVGTMEDGNYIATNGGIADTEGGKYTTTLTMTALSDESVQGIGASTYFAPNMQCEWTTSLSLTRKGSE